jgi:type II secretion system protein H
VRGFTLLEVVAVVCIIGVLAALVAIAAVPGEAAVAEKEARRLALLLELAAAETRASGEAIAWMPEPGGYAFWRKGDDGEWLRFPASSPYRPRAVDAAISIEGERAVFAASGLQAPMAATIRGGNAELILRSGPLGRVSLQRIHAH